MRGPLGRQEKSLRFSPIVLAAACALMPRGATGQVPAVDVDSAGAQLEVWFPAPAGLAAVALADSSFTWIRREAPGFRVYFLADSYAAAHQDSLLARLPPALAHARSLISAPALDGPIDL